MTERAPLPAVTGFAIWLGTRPTRVDAAPPFVVAGRRTPIATEIAGLAVHGTCVGPAAGPSDPLTTDGRTALVLAGELYNQDWLATALGTDGPATDAELVLSIYERYGVNGFRLLNGRFAAVLVDGGRIVIAADHAGSVPLYVRRSATGVAVATEAKVLAAAAVRHDELPGTRPVVGADGLHRVCAGAVLVVDRTAATPWPVSSRRTWAPTSSRTIHAPQDAVAAVAARLASAVRVRVGRGPVTIVLSGGIDSSAVASLAVSSGARAETVALGTDARDEFHAARTVAGFLGTDHDEVRVPAADLLAELPWAVAAAEIDDPDVLEYLLPLVALYRRIPGGPRRIVTGYGADIPLGGMHRTTEPLEQLDDLIAADMDGFDGLNELSPSLSGLAGHWSTHPYWDRDLLDLLIALEPGLKRRHGRDKWVLREAMLGRLPESTLRRPKLGIHEGSGLTSSWSRALVDSGVPADAVADAKRAVARDLYGAVVVDGVDPGQIGVGDVLAGVGR